MNRCDLRERVPPLLATALLGAALAAPSLAVDESLAVFPPSPTDLDRWTVTLSGEWPDSCTPQLTGVELKGEVVEIEAVITFPDEVCQAVVTPYEVSIEVSPLPAGSYSVEARGIPHFPPPALIARIDVVVVASADLGLEGIGLSPLAPTTQDRITVAGFGTWADGCVPRLDDIGFDGRLIRLSAVADAGSCIQVLTPFLLAEQVGPLAPGVWEVEVLIADRRFDEQAPFEVAGSRSFIVGPPSSDTQILGDRFAVTVSWTDGATQSGVGQPIRGALPDRFGTGSAAFWFFEPENTELLVKVLDGCGVNGYYWVFISAATDLGFEVLIGDTIGGSFRVYSNEPGSAAVAVTDIEAFRPCALP